MEDLTAARIESTDEIEKEWEKERIPLLVDPECRCLEDLKPLALVDAILAKKNLGTHRKMAKYTLALGPGFTAGADVDLVIETMARAIPWGRIIREGSAMPNTGRSRHHRRLRKGAGGSCPGGWDASYPP